MKAQRGAIRQHRRQSHLRRLAGWAERGTLALCLLALLAAGLAPAGPAFAGGGDDDPGNQAAGTIVVIFRKLAKLFISVGYVLMFIVFAVSSVRSGLGAQAAQAFGATGRVSVELLNLAGGVVIFVVALMTLPIVNMIIDTVTAELAPKGSCDLEIKNPVGIPGE